MKDNRPPDPPAPVGRSRRRRTRYPTSLTLKLSADMRQTLEELADVDESSAAEIVRECVAAHAPAIRDRQRKQRARARTPTRTPARTGTQ